MDNLSIRSGLCFEKMLLITGSSIYPEPIGACGRPKDDSVHQQWEEGVRGHEFIGWDQVLHKALEV
jgi:hypothetical protein